MKYNIAYICDDNYAMPTYVSMASVKNNLGGRECNIHVVTVGLSDDSKKEFYRFETDKFHVNIHEIDLSFYEKKIAQISQKSHVTPTALLKFELPNILEETDKVLYLDSDVIVKNNIDELLNYPIGNLYAVCAPELWKLVHKENTDNGYYFNSGVMLLNLQQLREDKISLKLWEEKIRISNSNTSKTMDQDTLNNVLGKRISLIPVKYNFNPYFAQKRYLKLVNYFNDHIYDSMKSLTEDIRIIHYVGREDKPWIYSSARMAEFWDTNYLSVKDNFDGLKRKKLNKGLKYKLGVVQKSIIKHGLLKTVRKAFMWRLY